MVIVRTMSSTANTQPNPSIMSSSIYLQPSSPLVALSSLHQNQISTPATASKEQQRRKQLFNNTMETRKNLPNSMNDENAFTMPRPQPSIKSSIAASSPMRPPPPPSSANTPSSRKLFYEHHPPPSSSAGFSTPTRKTVKSSVPAASIAVFSTPTRKEVTDTEADNNTKTSQDEIDEETVPNVTQLKGWLSEFGQKNKEHFTRNGLHVPPVTACNSNHSAATNPAADDQDTKSTASSSVASCNGGVANPASPPRAHPTMIRTITATPQSTPITTSSRRMSTASSTPNRNCNAYAFLPKPKPAQVPDDIQATNDSQASVRKLSEWLQDKPFEDRKKKGPLRTGSKVISRARIFEADMAAVETHVDVQDKKKWLESAFGGPAKKEEQVEPPTEATDDYKPPVKAIQSKFGGGVTPKKKIEGVAQIKQVLEQKQLQERLTNDYKAFHKQSWRASGKDTPPGIYKKTIIDSRGVAPPKKLDDLP